MLYESFFIYKFLKFRLSLLTSYLLSLRIYYKFFYPGEDHGHRT